MKHIKKIFESESNDSFKQTLEDYCLSLEEQEFDIIYDKTYKYTNAASKNSHYINKAQIEHQGKRGVNFNDIAYKVSGHWSKYKEYDLNAEMMNEVIKLLKRFDDDFICMDRNVEISFDDKTMDSRSRIEFSYTVKQK